MIDNEVEEVKNFVKKLLTRTWDSYAISQFQFDIHFPISVNYKTVAHNIYSNIISHEKPIFKTQHRKSGVVLSIKYSQQTYNTNCGTTTQNVINECGKLFESIVREINDVKN